MNTVGSDEEKEKRAILLQNDVDMLESELEEKYYSLGKSIFDLVDVRIKEMNDIMDNLVDKKILLADTMGYIICDNCFTHNQQGNKFCGKCGSPLKQS